jgi:quinol monooxygenase YgiN
MPSREIVHVVATFVAAPGREEELERVLGALVEPTRQEPGCLRYDLMRALDGSGEFVFVEEWETVESLDEHGRSPHVREAGARAPELLGAPAKVTRYRQIR